jgi:hypothetical protein
VFIRPSGEGSSRAFCLKRASEEVFVGGCMVTALIGYSKCGVVQFAVQQEGENSLVVGL